jgi:hypothetical protein
MAFYYVGDESHIVNTNKILFIRDNFPNPETERPAGSFASTIVMEGGHEVHTNQDLEDLADMVGLGDDRLTRMVCAFLEPLFDHSGGSHTLITMMNLMSDMKVELGAISSELSAR